MIWLLSREWNPCLMSLIRRWGSTTSEPSISMTPKVHPGPPHQTVLYKDHLGGIMNFHLLSLLNHNFVGKVGCNLDRHEDIGKGCIGIAAFRDIVNEPRVDNIPLILETPGRWGRQLLVLIPSSSDSSYSWLVFIFSCRPGFEYDEQIKLLYSLCKQT